MSDQSQIDSLDDLLARAENFAGFSMCSSGKVPPVLFAASPGGPIFFMPSSLADVRAKDNFANAARLICVAHSATAVVMVLEAWMKLAKSDGSLDLNEPPSEAWDRQEIVLLTGETHSGIKQKILPIIRTDAGGFFGFGEFQGPFPTSFEGRFAQMLPTKKPTLEMQNRARMFLVALGITAGSLGREPSSN